MRILALGLVFATCAGCAWGPPVASSYSPPPPRFEGQGFLPNPTLVPAADCEFVWNQIVDVVDDYFKIEREERPRLAGELLTDGRIDTFPQTGSTIFEPWNPDSANLYERVESTLQSIRRRAFIVVKPAEGGYLIDVAVMKELEDVERPEHATAGAATFRHDSTLERQTDPGFEPDRPAVGQDREIDQPRSVGARTLTAGWIPIGRDTALEQQIIAHLHARLAPLAPAPYITPLPGVR